MLGAGHEEAIYRDARKLWILKIEC